MSKHFNDIDLAELHIAKGYKVQSRDELAELLIPLHGLWRFAMKGEKGTRFFDLRLDKEYALASGDIFRDTERRAWMQSFRSTTAYLCVEGTSRFLVLNCDATLDERRKRRNQIARVLLRLQLEQGKIANADALTLTYDGKWRTEWAGELKPVARERSRAFWHEKDFFRQIAISYYFDDLLCSRDRHRATQVMGREVPKYMKAEGIAVTTKLKELDEGGTQFADISGPLAEVQSSTDPWTFSILFSGVSEDIQKENDRRKEVPFGRAVGLDGQPQRYRSRFGAIVFAGEMDRSLKEAQEAGDITALDFRMAFTVMHELGHMLNLPHPWQRDLAERNDNGPEPASETWMSYGSYFPVGAVAEKAYQKRPSKQEKKQRREAHQKFLYEFKQLIRDPKYGYSPAEREHLRHAAFDQIAVGTRGFTDALRCPLSLVNPSPSDRYQLTLHINGGTEGDELLFATDAGTDFAYEPPSGSLELTPKNGEPEDRRQFSFQSGAAQILVHGVEHPNDQETLPRASYAVHAYNPLVHFENGLDWGKDYDDYHGPMPEDGGALTLKLPLPLIPPRFWRQFDRKLAFRLQAVFVTPDGRRIYSNTVDTVYKTISSEQYSQLEPSVKEVRRHGLAAWRAQWIKDGVGLETGGNSLSESTRGFEPGLYRWERKLGAKRADPANPATLS